MKKIFFLVTSILIFKTQFLFAMETPLNLLEILAQVLEEPDQDCSSSSTQPEVKESPQISTESDQNIYSISYTQGHRAAMEDAFDSRHDKQKKIAFFAVYDGHGKKGGELVSNYLKKNLWINIEKTASIEKGFAKTNLEILQNTNFVRRGSTAIVALIENKKLAIANVGDSRAIISKNGKAFALSQDQNTFNGKEVDRIKKINNGFLKKQRVLGVLSPTRTFGNNLTICSISEESGDTKKTYINLKDYVEPVPEINTLELSSEYEYLILASDGLWDVIQNQEAIDFVKKFTKIQEASEQLVQLALKKSSTDNITVIIIDLKKLMESFNNHE